NVITAVRSQLQDFWWPMELMCKHRIRHLPVVDDQGQVTGLLTHESLQQLLRPVDLLQLRSAADVMVTEVICAQPDESILSLTQRMADHRVSCVVIVDKRQGKRRPIGMVTERDIVQFQMLELDFEHIQAQTVMSAPIISVQHTDSLWRVRQLMQTHRIARMVVTDGSGALLGLVTQTSLLSLMSPFEMFKTVETLQQKVHQLESDRLALLEIRNAELEQQVQARTAELQDQVKRAETLAVLAKAELEERKRVEAALRQSESRYATLTDAAPVGIFRTDAEGNCLYVNDCWCRVAGLTPAEAAGQGWVKGLHPEDRDLIYAEWYRCAQDNVPFQLEYRFQRSDGKVTWVYGQAVAERDEVGNLVGYIGTLTNISDRKHIEAQQQQSQQALQDSEATNRAIIQAIPDLLIRMDAQGNYSSMVNGRGVNVLDPSDTIQQSSVYDILPAEIARRRMHYTQKALETQTIQTYEQTLDTKGELHYEEVSITVLDNNEVLIIIRDVTDRKLTDIALQQLNQTLETTVEQRTIDLRQSQKMLQLVIDTIPQRVFWKDRAFRYLGCNQHFAKDAGLDSPAQIISKDDFSLIWAESSASLYRADDVDVMENEIVKINYEEPQHRADGSQAWLRTSKIPLHDDQGQVIGVLGTYEDITDRKQAELALQENEAKLRAIFSLAAVGIVQVDSSTHQFLKVNQKFCDILGYTETELLEKTFGEITCPNDMASSLTQVKKLYAGDISEFSMEKRYVRKDGSRVWAHATVSMVCRADGTPDYNVIVVKDISDRKRAEEKLHQTNAELARATRLKDEFLANMSHELRTPLNAILGLSEGLKDGAFGELSLIQRRSLTTIERSGRHLLELINDILDLAKIEAGKLELHLESVSINQLCQSSLAFVKQQAMQKRIQLKVDLATDRHDIAVDERRIRQVLINLLTNAVKFTPDGGTVTLSVNRVPADPETGLPASMAFSIQDTGIGIAQTEMDTLFQSFVQIDSSLNRQQMGTGLGLALVKRIAELHGGQVTVESEVGQGSRFTVRLPDAETSAPSVLKPLPVGRDTD
ncbi:MAG: PAS domain S-box protein, partial [Cyanobacteria bacterium P01_F01_bin.4]